MYCPHCYRSCYNHNNSQEHRGLHYFPLFSTEVLPQALDTLHLPLSTDLLKLLKTSLHCKIEILASHRSIINKFWASTPYMLCRSLACAAFFPGKTGRVSSMHHMLVEVWLAQPSFPVKRGGSPTRTLFGNRNVNLVGFLIILSLIFVIFQYNL